MSGIAHRALRAIACASALALAALHPLAQSRAAEASVDASAGWWTQDVTVVTMAPGGAWGTATEATASLAIAGAIADCRQRAGEELGCGAYSETIRAGWILGMRCGSHNILASDHDLIEAKRIAAVRETNLRRLYVSDLPACEQVLSVGPKGTIMPPRPAYSAR